MFDQRLQTQQVTALAEATDLSQAYRRNDGAVAEFLAGVDIGQVHLDRG